MESSSHDNNPTVKNHMLTWSCEANSNSWKLWFCQRGRHWRYQQWCLVNVPRYWTDRTYKGIVKNLLRFTYGAKPESICKVTEYNSVRPVVKTNASAVAGCFSRELISHLMFHSNQYACGKLDHVNGTFIGYEWTKITVSEFHQFLGNLLKMSLISLDIDGFKSLWYPPTHAMISPLCHFEIKDNPSWTQCYMSYCRCVQTCPAFHPESGTSKEGDKCQQLRNSIKQLNNAAKHTFVPGTEMSFNKGSIACCMQVKLQSSPTIQQQQARQVND